MSTVNLPTGGELVRRARAATCTCLDHVCACRCEKRPRIPPEPPGFTHPLDHFEHLIKNPPKINLPHYGFPAVVDCTHEG